MKIIKKIKKEKENKDYSFIRNNILKNITDNIGSITEEDDKFICYADQKYIDKENINPLRFDLLLMGISNSKEQKVIDEYNLNKPIYYIFDNIKFDKRVTLTSFFCKVIFRNCTFNGDIELSACKDVVFENNSYTAVNPLNKNWPGYLYGGTAWTIHNLTFKDENIFNNSENNYGTLNNFGIELSVDNINFINTKIDIDDINIKANRITAKDSTILAREVYLDSDSIDFEDSLVSAKEGIIIDNEKCDFNKSAYAPVVFYNGKSLDEKDETELDNARKKFITELKAISNYCKQLNDEKSKEIRKKLDNNSVNKVLSKRK